MTKFSIRPFRLLENQSQPEQKFIVHTTVNNRNSYEKIMWLSILCQQDTIFLPESKEKEKESLVDWFKIIFQITKFFVKIF